MSSSTAFSLLLPPIPPKPPFLALSCPLLPSLTSLLPSPSLPFLFLPQTISHIHTVTKTLSHSSTSTSTLFTHDIHSKKQATPFLSLCLPSCLIIRSTTHSLPVTDQQSQSYIPHCFAIVVCLRPHCFFALTLSQHKHLTSLPSITSHRLWMLLHCSALFFRIQYQGLASYLVFPSSSSQLQPQSHTLIRFLTALSFLTPALVANLEPSSSNLTEHLDSSGRVCIRYLTSYEPPYFPISK